MSVSLQSFVQVHKRIDCAKAFGLSVCTCVNLGVLTKASKKDRPKNVAELLNSKVGKAFDRKMLGLFGKHRKAMSDALREAYEDEGLGKATKTKKVKIDTILDAIDIEGFSVDIIDAVTPVITREFKSAGITAVARLGYPEDRSIVNHMDEAALEYAQTRGAELIGRTGKHSITDTTRDALRGLISDGIEEGWSSAKLASHFEDSFVMSRDRAEMIARTELAMAHVQGNVEGWKETGEVEKKKWIVSQDEVCDICQELDGVTIDLDDDFDGPDGPLDAPPAHPNCRCDIVPVLVQEKVMSDLSLLKRCAAKSGRLTNLKGVLK